MLFECYIITKIFFGDILEILLTFCRKDLHVLEREEADTEVQEQNLCARRLTEELHAEAFVEHMDRDQLCEQMFDSDPQGQALLMMGEEAEEIYNRYARCTIMFINLKKIYR